MSAQDNPNSIRSDFIEKVGLISQAEGLPRIAGRVFGLLVFDGTAVSFADLAERLLVSRASISTSVRLLEDRGLIKRSTRPGERQDYFQLAQNPYATLVEGARKRTKAAMAEIIETIKALPPNAEPAGRLSDYAEFYGSVESGLSMALQDMRSACQASRDHTINAREDG